MTIFQWNIWQAKQKNSQKLWHHKAHQRFWTEHLWYDNPRKQESFCKILFSKQQTNTHLCEERKNSLSVCGLYLVKMICHLSSLHHWERETSFNPFVDLWCDELFCVVYESLNESVVCAGRRAGQATWTRRLCDQGWKTVVTLTALAESMPTLSALVLSTLDVVIEPFFLFFFT